MALTSLEIKAKRIVFKQKQIATKLVQISSIEYKQAFKQTLLTGYVTYLNTHSDLTPYQIAFLNRKINSANALVSKYDAAINRYEAKRLEYAQQLFNLMGPF